MKIETDQNREQLFARLDGLSGHLHAAIDEGGKAAKSFFNWLDSLRQRIEESGTATPNGSDSFMTLEQVAAYLNYSKRAIQEWIANDGFPVRRCGADPRFDRAEVDEWTKRHRKNNRTSTAANGKVSPLQRDCKQMRSKANVSL